ncbi:hypothetical protein EYC84_007832 [Monilinia fructicola]|uniref:Uncharacterized protein n=1 Tax=Monilinia fructicola TaxID=38448 RepID=A0A5M9JKD9_MONFR|nr:hypothetical protein EYC84_007832 [Monilinia fructicola]
MYADQLNIYTVNGKKKGRYPEETAQNATLSCLMKRVYKIHRHHYPFLSCTCMHCNFPSHPKLLDSRPKV